MLLSTLTLQPYHTLGARLAIGLLLSHCPMAASAQDQARFWLREAVEVLCKQPRLTGFDAQSALPGTWLLAEEAWPSTATPRRTEVRLALPERAELSVERREINGQLQQFRVAYAAEPEGGGPLEPRLQAIADRDCQIQSAREIRRDEGPWVFLDQLSGDLETVRWVETLQAPWPDGTEPVGPRVALVDSGLAYDLPLFRERLARGPDGVPLGYDFWSDDPWPYDGDTSRGLFFPIRHGTTVASIFVREAPEATILPYRYPRPDMSRMADIVESASAAGARILAMPLGSRRIDDWLAFEEALGRHDILAIVSAGNDGLNIDETPVYPASLTAPNLITVTSADEFGQLAQGVNWGRRSVDIMLPAENLPVTDFRGASGVASGSSYAVPRLAALAARILAKEPELSSAELRDRIFALAEPSPFERAGVVSVGWIADPMAP